jgi:hypothetical protein
MPSKASLYLLERIGIWGTYRGPVPTVAPSDDVAHQRELGREGPEPRTVSLGDPPPDRGVTEELWPAGTECND